MHPIAPATAWEPNQRVLGVAELSCAHESATEASSAFAIDGVCIAAMPLWADARSGVIGIANKNYRFVLFCYILGCVSVEFPPEAEPSTGGCTTLFPQGVSRSEL